jgi:dihydrofolate synthase/folylpolyglutamate synthase
MNTDQDLLDRFHQVAAELRARWPESRPQPSLERVDALLDLLGSPQRAYPVIQITGTNGKTTVARMIDELLRGIGLRTGRYTSPHLESVTERICLDGEPISRQAFVDTYADVLPYVGLVDDAADVRMSFFEVITAMGYAAFADAPVDVAVVEVGLGGRWDATNIADAQVAVLTPISLDHTNYLGETVSAIATEKAGIIKPGATVVLAQQQVEAAVAVLGRAAEVDATVAREGNEFGVLSRTVAVGGQQVILRGLGGEYPPMFLPLHGAHQAHNAACALAAVEAFFGADANRGPLEPDVVAAAFANVRSPGRLEVVRRSPTILLDAAHNVGGAMALADAVTDAFGFSRLVGVVGVMLDKDARGMLEVLEPLLAEVVITQNSTDRSMPADQLAQLAVEVFGPDRVEVAPRLDDAIDAGVRLAEEDDDLGGAGVLITGSVVTVGEARLLLTAGRSAAATDEAR